VIYGGATGSGGLASDHLYQLEFKENLGVWSTVQTTGRTPGKRYGHIMCYAKPYLVVFGGNTAEKSVNDCWVLNIERTPTTWQEISSEHEVPCPRVYHSAALCSAGSAAGMIVIFGGRSADQSPLNDAWGLRRHRNGNWDWVKAPYKSKPRPRYQHTTLFMNSVMLVIGGRTNNVGESLPLETYDTENSEWHDFATAQRFRHGSWIYEDSVYIYGGFELNTPNVPTDALVRISLAELFQKNNALYSKLPPREGVPIAHPSSAIINANVSKPTTPKLVETAEDKPRKKYADNTEKKLTILEPVIGKPDDKPTQNFDIKRPLTSKQDIPYYFLNYLLQPKNYMNVEGLKFIFKPYHILSLCDFVEEILMEQPNVLQGNLRL
jgi:protein phosphatase